MNINLPMLILLTHKQVKNNEANTPSSGQGKGTKLCFIFYFPVRALPAENQGAGQDVTVIHAGDGGNFRPLWSPNLLSR